MAFGMAFFLSFLTDPYPKPNLSDFLGKECIFGDWMPVEDPVFSGDQVRHDEIPSGPSVIPAKAGIQDARFSRCIKIAQFR